MKSEAAYKANAKYFEKFDDIKIRVPKGRRDRYKAVAIATGKGSLNALAVELLENYYQAHAPTSETL